MTHFNRTQSWLRSSEDYAVKRQPHLALTSADYARAVKMQKSDSACISIQYFELILSILAINFKNVLPFPSPIRRGRN